MNVTEKKVLPPTLGPKVTASAAAIISSRKGQGSVCISGEDVGFREASR